MPVGDIFFLLLFLIIVDGIVSFKKRWSSPDPSTCECDFFEDMVFANNQVNMGSCWIRVSPVCNDWCLYKRKGRDIWMHKHRRDTQGKGHVAMEEKTGVKKLYEPRNAKDCW